MCVLKPTYLSGSMNNGIIDTESELIRQLSKLGRGWAERAERRGERNVSAWIEGTKRNRDSKFHVVYKMFSS